MIDVFIVLYTFQRIIAPKLKIAQPAIRIHVEKSVKVKPEMVCYIKSVLEFVGSEHAVLTNPYTFNIGRKVKDRNITRQGWNHMYNFKR
jgi:hypothetical protein